MPKTTHERVCFLFSFLYETCPKGFLNLLSIKCNKRTFIWFEHWAVIQFPQVSRRDAQHLYGFTLRSFDHVTRTWKNNFRFEEFYLLGHSAV
jgi:hypothetical protein